MRLFAFDQTLAFSFRGPRLPRTISILLTFSSIVWPDCSCRPSLKSVCCSQCSWNHWLPNWGVHLSSLSFRRLSLTPKMLSLLCYFTAMLCILFSLWPFYCKERWITLPLLSYLWWDYQYQFNLVQREYILGPRVPLSMIQTHQYGGSSWSISW